MHIKWGSLPSIALLAEPQHSDGFNEVLQLSDKFSPHITKACISKFEFTTPPQELFAAWTVDLGGYSDMSLDA